MTSAAGTSAVGDDVPQRHETDDSGRTVLSRIAAIMDVFDDEGDRSLSLVDISSRAHLPKSTVHRLAEQLRAVGWLERDHAGYRVGMRMFELGGLALQHNRLRDIAFPYLLSLATKTGLCVQLGVLDGLDVVYLERVLVGDYTLPTRLGGRMPAHCTALGKAMLAYDEATADAVLASELPRRTDNTITTADALRDNLVEVRQAGVAFDLGEACDDLVCVAAPIRNSGRAIGALSVTGPAERMDWGIAVEAVQHAAANIWAARFGGVRQTRLAWPRR